MQLIGVKSWEVRFRGAVPPDVHPDLYLAEVIRMLSVSATLLSVGPIEVRARLLDSLSHGSALGPRSDA